MLDQSELLRRVDEAYARRVAGDGASVARYFTPDAVFRMPGTERLLPKHVSGEAAAASAIQTLIEMFRFHAFERLEWVVEGHKLAIRSRVALSLGDGPAHTTELFDLLIANADGLFEAMTQFADTALIADLLKERAR